MNKLIGIGTAMLFAMVLIGTSFGAVVNIAVSYNSVSNTIAITPATNVINANYSGTYYLNFSIIGANAIPSNIIIVPTNILINAPSKPNIILNSPTSIPVNIGENNFVLGGASSNAITNRSATISINQYNIIPPSRLSINIGAYSPSWNNSVPISQSNSSYSVSGTINRITKLNISRVIIPSWATNATILNSMAGVNVIVDKIPNLNITKQFSPEWNKTQSFMNSTYGINFTVAKISKLNITKVLAPGNSIINNTYGINITAEPITANMLTSNDLISYYNSQTASCLSYINFTANGTKYSLCARGSAQANYSIVNICTGLSQYTNLSYGLAGCVGTFAKLANESAQSWHQQYLETFSKLQNTTSVLDAYKNGSVIAQQYTQFYTEGATLLLVTIIGYILYDARKKALRQIEKRPPISKA